MSIAANLKSVHNAINRACAQAGRRPEEVRLLPVSKTVPADRIRQAYAAGVRLVGENKVQEAAGKAAELTADCPDLRWAMIGHLQSNKAKDVAALADEFQALDSAHLARELDRRLERLDRSLEVFIEVNSSDEDSKFGVPPEQVADLAAALADCDRLRPRGLMTIAVNSPDRELIGACFDRMLELRQQLADDDRISADYAELSMGMSGDFELAIAYGATTVRVGQAIFGPRPYP
jgi:pyridoxal phosphate enzyme (YggS family)